MSVGIVTDSACSLPSALAEQNRVVVVPMWVSIGGHQYRDGKVGISDVLERFDEGVSTSGPSPGELASAMASADQGDGVVVLTISSKMSSVYESARVAAATLEDGEVAVVDTGTAAGAQGLVVLAAAKEAASGAGAQEVVRAANAAARATKLFATLPSLTHLARGGRVPGAAAWGARWLGLSPLFEFRSGRIAPLRPARGPKAANQRMLSAITREAERARGAALHVAALHALEAETAAALLEGVRRVIEPASSFIGEFGPVMIAHTGPGLVGLAWRWETAAVPSWAPATP